MWRFRNFDHFSRFSRIKGSFHPKWPHFQDSGEKYDKILHFFPVFPVQWQPWIAQGVDHNYPELLLDFIHARQDNISDYVRKWIILENEFRMLCVNVCTDRSKLKCLIEPYQRNMYFQFLMLLVKVSHILLWGYVVEGPVLLE